MFKKKNAVIPKKVGENCKNCALMDKNRVSVDHVQNQVHFFVR